MRFCPSCGTRFSQDTGFCPHDGSPTEVLPEREAGEDPLLGTVIDQRYRVEERIGEGGMGVVYRARHVVLGKPLALKVLRAELAGAQEVVQRFIQEAQAASSIGHPNIIDIHDFGRLPDGSVYFVMEHLDGYPLTGLLAGGAIPVREAIPYLRQIASALGAAHAQGIVHRDLKPDNIFLVGPDKEVRVLDFGIAKVGNARVKLTRTGVVFGTPHYMSPEQAAGQAIDQRTDVYALGVIAYQMMTGEVPFDADTFMGILSKHMFQPVVPPTQTAGGRDAEPRAMENVILRALAKRPEDRYPGMAEILQDLEVIERGGMVPGPGAFKAPADAAVHLEPEPEPTLPSSRRPLWILGGLAVLAAGAVAAIVAVSAGAGGGDTAPPLASARGGAPPAEPATAPVEPSPGAEPAAPPPAPIPSGTSAPILLQSDPPGAEVTEDGVLVGNTPMELPRPAEGEVRELTLIRRGYEPAEVRVEPGSPHPLEIAMVRRGHGERPTTPGSTPPGMTEPVADTHTPTEMTPTAMDTLHQPPDLLSGEVVDPWNQ